MLREISQPTAAALPLVGKLFARVDFGCILTLKVCIGSGTVPGSAS